MCAGADGFWGSWARNFFVRGFVCRRGGRAGGADKGEGLAAWFALAAVRPSFSLSSALLVRNDILDDSASHRPPAANGRRRRGLVH